MPRVPRLDFPDARHHVMNRGARKAPVFGDDDAKALFLEVLSELPGRFDVRVHGYAIMSNHYHLMLSTPRANLSRAMRHLGAGFTQRLNRGKGWDGPVFRGRFKNRIAGDFRYWMHLLSYLHLNPVPHLATHPANYRWSSHRAYLGLEPVPSWLTTTDLIDRFGSVESIVEYVDEQMGGLGREPDGWDAERLWSPPPTEVVGPPPVPQATQDEMVDLAFAELEQVLGVPEAQFTVSLRGRRDNRRRWVAAWWLGRRAGLTHRQISHLLGCSPASVANLLQRLKERPDPQISDWQSALEAKRAPKNDYILGPDPGSVTS